MVQISALEVCVEGDFRRELRVEGYALTLRIRYRFGLPRIYRSFKIGGRRQGSFLNGAGAIRRVASVVDVAVDIWGRPNQPVHPFYLVRILRQVGLVFAAEDDIFVVGPPDLLIGKKVVAGLLPFSLYLLLKSGRNIGKALLVDTAGASKPLP